MSIQPVVVAIRSSSKERHMQVKQIHWDPFKEAPKDSIWVAKKPKTSLNKSQVLKLFQVCISTTALLFVPGLRKRPTRFCSRVLAYVTASYNQSVEANQARTDRSLLAPTPFEYRV